jgi:hypothetical protein
MEELARVAQRIRASTGLGRSHMLHRLFDYLLECTLKGETPKEVEVAADVFGKSGSDLLADASVRVYVHRLRKKLDEYYAGPGRDDAVRLTLPKSDYRFQLETLDAADGEPKDAPDPTPIVPASRGFQPWLLGLAGLLIGGALVFALMHFTAPNDGLKDVRSSSVWSSLLASHKPLTIVSGDYYILGERDGPSTDPARLVREFAVNSREELDELIMNDPAMRDKYVDLDLYYLPVSTTYALKTVMPILTPGLAGRPSVLSVPSSKLTPPQLKNGDLVYVGLLSGLGLLQQPVFANSRFAIGGSYDEIIDAKTGQLYAADPPRDAKAARRNFAYVAMLPGPNGNHILIVAGTRDPAVLQAADILNSPAMLKKLEEAGKDGFFEALYAVDGVGDENLKGTLIAAGPRSIEGMWDGMLDPPEAPANAIE